MTAPAWAGTPLGYPRRTRGQLGLLYRAVEDAELAYHRQYDEAVPPMVVAPGVESFPAAAAFHRTRPPEVPPPVAAVVSVAGVVSITSTVRWAIPVPDRLDEVGRSPAALDSLLRWTCPARLR